MQFRVASSYLGLLYFYCTFLVFLPQQCVLHRVDGVLAVVRIAHTYGCPGGAQALRGSLESDSHRRLGTFVNVFSSSAHILTRGSFCTFFEARRDEILRVTMCVQSTVATLRDNIVN